MINIDFVWVCSRDQVLRVIDWSSARLLCCPRRKLCASSAITVCHRILVTQESDFCKHVEVTMTTSISSPHHQSKIGGGPLFAFHTFKPLPSAQVHCVLSERVSLLSVASHAGIKLAVATTIRARVRFFSGGKSLRCCRRQAMKFTVWNVYTN